MKQNRGLRDFKKGDMVICIDNHFSDLVKYETYTIEAVSNSMGAPCVILLGNKTNWNKTRFILDSNMARLLYIPWLHLVLFSVRWLKWNRIYWE